MAKTAEQPPHRGGMWRGLWASLLIGLGIPGIVLLAAAVAWVFRIPLAEWAVRTVAASSGLESAHVDIVRLAPTGLEVRDVRLDETVRTDSIMVSYNPRSLADGWVDQVNLNGLIVTVPETGDESKSDPSALIANIIERTPLVPVRRLTLQQSRFQFGQSAVSADIELQAISPDQIAIDASGIAETPAGQAGFAATGRIDRTDGGLSASVAIESQGNLREASGKGTLALQVTLDTDGQISGTAEIEVVESDLSRIAQVRVGTITSAAKFMGDLAALSQLKAQLNLRNLVLNDTWSFAEVPIEAELTEGTLQIAARIDAPESGLIANAKLRTQLPVTDLSIEMSGTALPGLLPMPPDLSADGTVRFTAEAKVRDPLVAATKPPAAWTSHVEGSARTDINLHTFDLPLPIGLNEAHGLLNWSFSDEELLIDATPGFRAQIQTPDELTSRFGEAVSNTVDIEFGGAGRTPAAITIAPNKNGWEIALATSATSPNLNISGEADLRAVLDQTSQPIQLAIPFLVLEAADLSLFGLDGRAELAVTDVRGDENTASGQVTGSITIPRWNQQSITAQNLTLDFDTSASWANNRLTLRPETSTRLSFAAATFDPYALKGGFVALRPDSDPSVVIGRDGTATANLGFAPLSLYIDTPWGTANINAPAIDISGAETNATVTFEDARFSGIRDVVAEATTGQVTIHRDAPTEFNAVIERLRSSAANPEFSEMRAEVSGQAVDAINADVRLTNSLAGLDLRAEVSHDLRAQSGRATLTLDPLTFSPLAQPTDISPRYAARVSDVVGTVSADGVVSWEQGNIGSDLAVQLDALGLTANGVKLKDLNANLRVTGVQPPSTAPSQEITFAIEQGTLGSLPVKATFELRPDGIIAIDNLEAEAIAGRIRATDLAVDTSDPQTLATVLSVENIDLGDLLALTKVQGFTGTGRLSGEIPLRLEDGQLAITDAELSAAGSGKVQFDRSKLPAALLDRGDVVSMALETLTDFDYDSLDMRIDKSLDGEGTVIVRLAGANPDVLEGHPFRFNIALESDFDELARLITEGLSTADAVLFDAAAGAR